MFEALKCESVAQTAAKGRTLRFLANVDPVDVSRAITGYVPTVVVVVAVVLSYIIGYWLFFRISFFSVDFLFFSLFFPVALLFGDFSVFSTFPTFPFFLLIFSFSSCSFWIFPVIFLAE